MFTSSFTCLTLCCACWPCWKPAPTVRHWHRPVVVHSYPACDPGTIVVDSAHPPVVEKAKEMPKAEKSLYERLGGEAAVKAVIDDFVGRAAGNPKVNFTRKGTPAEWKVTPEKVDHLKMMLVELVGAVTGGPQKYTGRSMKDAHKGMMISETEFTALAEDLKATLNKFKVPEKEQAELLKIIGGTAPDIIEKKVGK